MYLHDLQAGLRRRWWAVVVGLLATAGLCYMALTYVPAEQEAKASVLLLPPRSTVGSEGNPYLVMGGLQPAADVLARALNDGQIHESLAPPHGPADFVVERDAASSGPVLVVDVTGTDPGATIAMLNDVLGAMPDLLDKLQLDVSAPTNSLITLATVASDAEAVPSTKSQMRAVLVAAAGGLAVTVFGTYMLDGLLVRRRQQREERRASAAQSAVPSESQRPPFVPVAPHTPTPPLPRRRSARGDGATIASQPPSSEAEAQDAEHLDDWESEENDAEGDLLSTAHGNRRA